jgi:hypothetical protein
VVLEHEHELELELEPSVDSWAAIMKYERRRDMDSRVPDFIIHNS